MPISLDEVRRRILIAMFSDDQLMEALVLKGGNALALVHEVGNRASIDMDFSIPGAFPDFENAKARILSSLYREFSSIGYVVFDERLSLKPSQSAADQPDWWGGYLVEFKLLDRALYEQFRNDPDSMRRRAEVVGPHQQRIYSIDISKHEYCATKVRKEVDDYMIYVYSLEMIAIEKLRAICQQMPQYAVTKNKRPRARDFYDVHEIVEDKGVDLALAENLILFEHIFGAKQVPLSLLGEIYKHREFHELDWPAVEASISGTPEPFGYYFDYVVELASTLKALWIK